LQGIRGPDRALVRPEAKRSTISAIADAAAYAANAKSDEERYAAAEKWREALSRPRYSN
jgi:hypothetical protein